MLNLWTIAALAAGRPLHFLSQRSRWGRRFVATGVCLLIAALSLALTTFAPSVAWANESIGG